MRNNEMKLQLCNEILGLLIVFREQLRKHIENRKSIKDACGIPTKKTSQLKKIEGMIIQAIAIKNTVTHQTKLSMLIKNMLNICSETLEIIKDSKNTPANLTLLSQILNDTKQKASALLQQTPSKSRLFVEYTKKETVSATEVQQALKTYESMIQERKSYLNIWAQHAGEHAKFCAYFNGHDGTPQSLQLFHDIKDAIRTLLKQTHQENSPRNSR